MSKRKGTKPPEGESKHDKFIRLAEARVPMVINRIRQVANLAGVSYDYTEEESAFIVKTLQEEVDRVKAGFGGTRAEAATFQLPKATTSPE